MRKLERSISWLRRSLLLAPAVDEPLVLPGVLNAYLDVLGTDSYKSLESVSVVGAAAATQVVGGAVPDGEIHFVLAASLESNDPVSRNLFLFMARSGAVGATLASNPTVFPVNVPLACFYQFYMPQGFQLVGNANAMAAGQALTLRWTRIVMPIGEYTK